MSYLIYIKCGIRRLFFVFVEVHLAKTTDRLPLCFGAILGQLSGAIMEM